MCMQEHGNHFQAYFRGTNIYNHTFYFQSKYLLMPLILKSIFIKKQLGSVIFDNHLNYSIF